MGTIYKLFPGETGQSTESRICTMTKTAKKPSFPHKQITTAEGGDMKEAV